MSADPDTAAAVGAGIVEHERLIRRACRALIETGGHWQPALRRSLREALA